MPLNFSYVDALKLVLPEYNSISLLLVGCGGTGSWLAPAVVRVGRLLVYRFRKNVQIHFVDPDRVEEKNVYRQNFCTAEIGRFKAETLAQRYGLAWGIEVAAQTSKFDRIGNWSDLSVLIGCVDNWKARKSISKSLRSGCWWLDSGNTKNGGQILLGSDDEAARKTAFTFKGCSGWLPSPEVQHPELISPLPQKARPRGGSNSEPNAESALDNLSCAEMALQDSQGLAINQRMAAEAADYLVRMLITKDLKKYATYIDLESGTTQSKYITKDNLAHYGKL